MRSSHANQELFGVIHHTVDILLIKFSYFMLVRYGYGSIPIDTFLVG